jgi:hypothetical protein
MSYHSQIKEISVLLNDYFEVLYTQDLVLFDRVFHEKSVLYNSQNDTVSIRPISEYRKVVEGRKSPKDSSSPRMDEVVSIDFLSKDMALVKVKLKLYDNVMQDYLNLIKENGQWRIAAKMWTRVEHI